MRFLTFVMLFILTTLPAVVSGQSNVYRLCKNSNSSHDICYYRGEGNYTGHWAINSYVNDERYTAYFFPDGSFTAYRQKNNKKDSSIDVAKNGLVGRNLEVGEYYPSNKNYNNTLSDIRFSFLAQPDWKRRSIQRTLSSLNLYNSSIDGLWGRNTFIGIIGYRSVFQQSLNVSNRYAANRLLNAINSHNRFDYKNGKLKKIDDTCNYTGSTRSTCPPAKVCAWATVGSPKRWNNYSTTSKNWVAEAKRRGLSCGVSISTTNKCSALNPQACSAKRICELATDFKFGKYTWATYSSLQPVVKEAKRRKLSCGVGTSKSPSTGTKPCSTYSVSSCSNQQLCQFGTTGTPKRWSTGLHGKKYAAEARSRGLSCSVNENKASAPSTNNCSNDPTKCGAVELCQKAVETKSGKVFWRTDVYGKSKWPKCTCQI